MKRLFFALWPDTATRQQCAQIQSWLPGDGQKPVTVSNLHVTLVFLGSVDQATEIALQTATAKVSVTEVSITFDQLSFWRQPEILCLTSTTVAPVLSELIVHLACIAKQLNIAIDERPYTPHITLARKAKQAVAVDFVPIIWNAEGFCLVESCSTPTGVEYRVQQSWGL